MVHLNVVLSTQRHQTEFANGAHLSINVSPVLGSLRLALGVGANLPPRVAFHKRVPGCSACTVTWRITTRIGNVKATSERANNGTNIVMGV